MKRILILTLALVLFLPTFAVNEEKFSATTRVFLLEQKNGTPTKKRAPKTGAKKDGISEYRVSSVASPEMVGGVKCISAFIRLDDNTNVADIEALGVTVRDKFQNGLITAFIPVDKLDELSDISRVKRINVASRMRPLTDKGRQYTNTDDVLTLSTDAVNAGLPQIYDGAGVLMGVTDAGIDFQHKAFRDKNDGYRAVGAYQVKVNSSGSVTSRTEYTQSTMANATYDDASDHGTHTCSTAGGSSVIVNGSTVTVTDDHSQATYGGMAPGSDLWLAGVGDLNDTDLASSFSKIISYASNHNMPVVISNSWGSGWGARDGSSDFADVVNQYFGDQYPNRVCLFASSNDAGNTSSSAPGGTWIGGSASSSSPLGAIMNCYSPSYGYDAYGSHIASAWSRNSTSLRCNIYIINSNGSVVASKTGLSGSSNGTTVSGLSSYLSGTLQLISETHNGKAGLHFYSNGSDYLAPTTSSNRIAIEVYPSSGSSRVDVWCDAYCWFSADKTTTGHTWTRGSDDMSVSDEATIANAISVGAYVSKTSLKNYSGQTQSYSSGSLGDIADFSSYATAAASPTGIQYPFITAPGAQIVSAVNHNSTEYISGDSKSDRVNTNTTYPYGAMQGTSMATPTAAGIVAVWLQVAKENNLELTLTQIKEIMQNSAIRDSYVTSGGNASHFGNGKIDCLAGIKYILDNYVSTDPSITASPAELTFNETVKNQTATLPLEVTGRYLTGNITATLGGANASMFSLSTSSLSSDGGTITVTYAPTTVATHNATITLSSAGASNVVVNVTGNATFLKAEPVLNDVADADITESSFKASWTDETESAYVSSYDLQVNMVGNSTTVDDVLNNANTIGATQTTYTTWTSTGTSGAVYAGQSAGQNGTIQVRTTNNNSGIVSTTSAGKIRKVTVTWSSLSSTGKTLQVYGNNTAYTAPSELYSNSTNQGTLLGTIVCGTTTELEISADYAYVGVRSASGAVWMDNITFTWETDGSGSSSVRRKATETGASHNRSVTGITDKYYTVSGLNSGETYKFKVRSHYSDGTQTGWTAEKSVTLKGEKTLHPYIVADETVSFGTVNTGSSATANLSVLAEELKGDVTLTLTDPNNVFSLSSNTIAKASAMEGATVTVTFTPAAAQAYNATVLVQSEDAEDVTVTLTGTGALVKEVPVLSDATNVGNTSFTANWNTVANAASYTLEVNKQQQQTTTIVDDVLNNANTINSTANSYSSWTATGTSGAEYAGQSAGQNGTLQLRSNNSNSGIVSTTSGGKIKKVKVSWNSGTGSERTLNVYGSNSAYINPSNLYTSSSQGTLLGTIVCGTSTELVISDDYEYVGVRSASGAMYLDNITFTWESTGAAGAPRRAAVESGDADSRTITGIEAGTYTVTGLTAGATYEYKVKAIYTDNDQSAWSDAKTVTLQEQASTDPEIIVDPSTLTFDPIYTGATATKTFDLMGDNLTEGVTLTLGGADAAMFSLSTNSLTVAQATDIATVTVTYAPTAVGSHTATVTLSSAGAESVTVTLNGSATLLKEVPVLSDATNVGNTSFTANWNTVANAASYTLEVNKQQQQTTAIVDDVLNNANTIGEATTSYSSWTATGTSGAEYAGQSAGYNTTIQLRSNYSNSGIVSTTSGGKIKKVTVSWNSGTGSERTLNVYGSNSVYDDPTDLYSSSTQGTLLGTIVCGTSTELVISDDYEYVGVRSASGAMYLDNITFTWESTGAAGAPRRAAVESGDADSRTITGIEAGTYTVNNLTPGATYEYKVKAVYTDETESVWSTSNTVTLEDNTSVINVASETVEFGSVYTGSTNNQTFNVSAENLTEGVTLTLSGSDAFSIQPESLTLAQAEAGATVTVTYAPTTVGNHIATVTLASAGAASKTVALSGSAELEKLIPELDGEVVENTTTSFTASWSAVPNAESYTLVVGKQSTTPEPDYELLLDEDMSESSTTWTATNTYTDVDGYLRLGASKSIGSVESPSINLAAYDGVVTVVIDGRYYSSDNSSLKLTVGSASETFALTDEDATYVKVLTTTAGTCTVKIEGTANKKRILLSRVRVYGGDASSLFSAAGAPRRKAVSETGDADNRTITGITATQYTVENLTENATFDYKVQAVYTDGTSSEFSATKSVNLSIPTDIIETLADGTIVVANGIVAVGGDVDAHVYMLNGVEIPAEAHNRWNLAPGLYIIKAGEAAQKIMVK